LLLTSGTSGSDGSGIESVDGNGNTGYWAMAAVMEILAWKQWWRCFGPAAPDGNLAVVMEVFPDNGLQWQMIRKRYHYPNNY